MLLKEKVYFLTLLILIAGLTYVVKATQAITVSFSSSGVTVNSTFPEEARPLEVVALNITITSTSPVTLRSFAIAVMAQQGQDWQEIYNGTDTVSQTLPRNYNLQIALPQWVNGRLNCSILLVTSNLGDLSATFYSTMVSEVTFSEIQTLYYQILADHSNLEADHSALLGQYDKLLANCSALLTNYDTLRTQYDKLHSEYNALRSEYDMINEAYENETDEMQKTISASETTLLVDRVIIVVLAVAIAILIISTVYAKRKASAPYVVVNKETVE